MLTVRLALVHSAPRQLEEMHGGRGYKQHNTSPIWDHRSDHGHQNNRQVPLNRQIRNDHVH